jgi:hypothetical protein
VPRPGRVACQLASQPETLATVDTQVSLGMEPTVSASQADSTGKSIGLTELLGPVAGAHIDTLLPCGPLPA